MILCLLCFPIVFLFISGIVVGNTSLGSAEIYDKLNSSLEFFVPHYYEDCSLKNYALPLVSVLRQHVKLLYQVAEGSVPMTVSILVIQCWWRAVKETSRFLNEIKNSNQVKASWIDVETLQSENPKAFACVKKFVRLLSFHRYLRSSFERIIKKKVHFDISRDIVRDVMEETLDRCIHTDEVSRMSVLSALSDMMANSSMIVRGAQDSEKRSSFPFSWKNKS